MNFKRLVAVVGSSGTGKTTIVNSVFDIDSIIISHASREKRENEVDGEDYHFVSKEKMLEMRNNDEFYEFTEFNGNLYGFAKSEFENKLSKRQCACILTYDGLETLLEYKKFKDIILPVFLFSNKEKVEKNLKKRDGEDYKKRLLLYEKETENNLKMYKSLTNAKYIDVSELTESETIEQFKKIVKEG